ncbi:MAG: LysM peptidoglycan-binding domain-containing protein [Marinicaulis sp.]|nr:LysM peptidoglycan-binding domain-containing protein [Marinicaulis sp.]
MKKSRLMTYCAAAALGAAYSPVAIAADQTPDAPAGTQYAPVPTVQEEIVYMRDIIAVQTLRLDQAEQGLSRQSGLIDAQALQIAELQQMVTASQQMMASLGAAAPPTIMADSYRVESGDTLSLIARKHNTTIAVLASANDLKTPYRLSIGQRLNVPGNASAARLAQALVTPTPTEEKITSSQAPASKEQPQRVAAAQTDTPPGPTPGERPDVTQRALTNEQRKRDDQPAGGTPDAVGVRPEEEEERPYLSVFSDVGGILTPKGSMFVEPSVDYTVSSDNRFFFGGVEIVDAVLIGVIEATDTDRRALTESLSFRYGITNRLEIDGRIAHVSRDDRISGVAIDSGTTVLRNLDGSGLGDTDIGLHYQLNSGKKFPYTILNLRGKAPTGLGPFEVARDAAGIETELATGSGFWTVEPSLTMILPTAPAVIFANVGYQANLSVMPNQGIGPNLTILEFDPGDAIRTSFGIGLSVNERLSLNFGYDQTHFFKTRTLLQQDNIIDPLDLDGDGVQDILRDMIGDPVVDSNNNTIALFSPPRSETRNSFSPATTIGSFLFGASYAVNDKFRLNLNTAFGATDESPDMRVSLRAQYKLFD